MGFEIIDHISDPGDAGKPNDDHIMFDQHIAAAVDGATGLTNQRLVDECESDAAWLAENACKQFLSTKPDHPIRDLVMEIINEAREGVSRRNDLEVLEKYKFPNASFIMARHQGPVIELSGLGDCNAFVEFSDGSFERFSALPFHREKEVQSALSDLQNRSGNEEALQSPVIMEILRQNRNIFNTDESGIWTLGLIAEAASRVFTLALPAGEIRNVLLMTDGFSALSDCYNLYAPEELIGLVQSQGLDSLNQKMRHIERVDDPDLVQYPRYKRCDDSSAIMLKMMG